jgi:DNA-binding response OmpR family regulator
MALILILSDDKNLTQFLSNVCFQEGHQAIASDSPVETINIAQQVRVDLVIADANRILATRTKAPDLKPAIRSALFRSSSKPVPKIILFSEAQMKLGVENVLPSFRKDCDLALVKPIPIDELVAHVRTYINEDSSILPAQERSKLYMNGVLFDLKGHSLNRDNNRAALTPTEFELLKRLTNNPGEVVSNEDLLLHVWGYTEGTASPELVRTHISNLRAKINSVAPEPVEIILTVPRRGYVIPERICQWE